MSSSRLFGVVAVLSSLSATPVLAQAVIQEPGYCAFFYPNANCQNKGPGNPYGKYQQPPAQRNDWSSGETVGMAWHRSERAPTDPVLTTALTCCGTECGSPGIEARRHAKRKAGHMMQLESTLTCPSCGHQSVETMPTDACQFFYDCKGCGTRLKPLAGDCCVFCSYGSVPCPPVQSSPLAAWGC